MYGGSALLPHPLLLRCMSHFNKVCSSQNGMFSVFSQTDTGHAWDTYSSGEMNAREVFVPNIQAVSTSAGGLKVR